MNQLYLSGVSQISKGNQSKAIELWEAAAKQDCCEAIDSLINIYRFGRNTDIERALFWVEKVRDVNPERYKKIISELKNKKTMLDKELGRSNMSYRDFDSADQSVVESCLDWGDQIVSDMTEIDPD